MCACVFVCEIDRYRERERERERMREREREMRLTEYYVCECLMFSLAVLSKFIHLKVAGFIWLFS